MSVDIGAVVVADGYSRGNRVSCGAFRKLEAVKCSERGVAYLAASWKLPPF